MINPLVLYGAIGSLIVGVATGWTIRDWKADADGLNAMEKAERIRNDLQAKYDDITYRFALEQDTANTNSVTRQTELRTIYRDIKTDSNCAAPDSVRGMLQDGVDEANSRSTGKPINSMPKTDESSQSANRP